MNKRDFIKTTMLAGMGLTVASACAGEAKAAAAEQGLKHWVWENPNHEESDEDLQKKYSSYYEAGVRGMFFEHDSERHFRIAKKAGLETHRWMWTMNRGEKELLASHPEWYAVSRDGKSCADNPPYVGYYRWLCPSKPEVKEYLAQRSKEILEKDYVDGLHLDYVRYCDVILPVNLWDNYGIDQSKELPEYDFCYCDTCRENFKKKTGKDPLEMEHPDQSPAWRKYRYEQVNGIVNHLAEITHSYNKPITAAVFPTPEIARRIVRQDWTNWNLDAVCPMIYHGFYRETVSWIGDAVEEGMHFLCGKFPIYAGLFLPDFKSDEELEEGIRVAIKNGASGVSLFGKIDEKTLGILKKASK
ncbi:family 10 glycosylhydrolase [Draconibacterium sediminis]|uniref:family 10 glycosylhydrolase n=1 Tax=Draconibacterium sediminis TaxID=1544798 RepID=UPI0026EF4C6D|nr:family 10 glycosylhydrolase [Draconibacterium sediminis]